MAVRDDARRLPVTVRSIVNQSFEDWELIVVDDGSLDGSLAAAEALAAADMLAKEGISAEVVDPRCLVPMDAELIRASVRKTGRLVVADEAGPTAGASAEIATLVTEDPDTFKALKGAVRRVCALQVPIPYAPHLEDHVFPDRQRIVEGVRAVMAAS